MKYLNSKKGHISGKYKYDGIDDVEFIQLLENGEVNYGGNKLTYKDRCWRLGKVKREIPDDNWGNGGEGWPNPPLKTVYFPIEYKSEGSFLKQVYKLYSMNHLT